MVPRDGAHQVVNHHKLQEALTALGITQVDAIFMHQRYCRALGYHGRVAALVDEGVLQTTLTRTIPSLTPVTLAQAHAELEAGRMVGKLVIDMSGFAN